jgi:hypothetical protein
MKNQPASSAPVTIPLVVLTVHRNGTITVTKDGTVLPPHAHSMWRRSSLPEIIETASEQRTVPVWVEVHETDGTSFTDLFPAQPQRCHHEERAASKPGHAASDPQPTEIRAEAGEMEYDQAKAHLDDCLTLAGNCYKLLHESGRFAAADL